MERAGFTITTKAWLDRQDLHYQEQRRDYFAWVDAYARENHYLREAVVFLHPFPVPPPVEITAEDLAASDTDTAVYLISRTSGEGSDRRNERGDYLLFSEELAQLRQLRDAYAKLIVVLNIGGVMDLKEMKEIPGMRIFGEAAEKGSVISFLVGDIHHFDMGTLLDRLGIAVRTGHHCAQPLMQRLGIEGTVRASFALYNTKEEIDALVAGVERVSRMF